MQFTSVNLTAIPGGATGQARSEARIQKRQLSPRWSDHENLSIVKGRPLNFAVTGGQVHDSQVVNEVLNTPRSPLAVTADNAYDSEKARRQIKDVSALPVIRSNASKKAYCPKRFYRQRHKIENFFCRVKHWRRIATRYDKLACNFLAATLMVGALYWIKL